MKILDQSRRHRPVGLGLAAFLCLGLFLASSCSDSMDDGQEPSENDTSTADPCAEPGFECAKHVLETEYLPDNGEIRFVNEHHIVGGDFKFMEVAVDYESRVADKFALWADGERLRPRKARERFTKLHQEVWGALTISAAEFAHERPDEVGHFGMWYNADELPPRSCASIWRASGSSKSARNRPTSRASRRRERGPRKSGKSTG